MTEDRNDDALSRLLRRWGPPPLEGDLDLRVLEAYRRQTRPWWRRFLAAEVRVPLPVAAVLLLLLIVSTALALRPAPGSGSATTPAGREPVQAAQRQDPAVVTHTNLDGFQPVEEMQITVVPEARP
jgi:hypothetical protein